MQELKFTLAELCRQTVLKKQKTLRCVQPVEHQDYSKFLEFKDILRRCWTVLGVMVVKFDGSDRMSLHVGNFML